jgi:hypothetical protein
MFKHPKLVQYAETIEAEKRQAKEIIAKKPRTNGGGGGPSTMVPLDAHGVESDHVVGTQPIQNDHVIFAETVIRQAKMESEISPAKVAKLLTVAGVSIPSQGLPPRSSARSMTYEEEKKDWSKRVSRLVRRAARINLGSCTPEDFEDECKRINREELASIDGVHKDQQQACSLDQLKARHAKMVSYIQGIHV